MKNTLVLLSLLTLAWACTPKETSPTLLDIVSPAGNNTSLPNLVTGEDGKLYLSWIEKQDSGMVLFYYASMTEDTWSAPELIASGKDWFVNWADYPMIAVDKAGNMVAHYLAKSASGTYSYDVNVVYKTANGDWNGPIIPHKDGTPTEHGFATLLPQNDGTFLLAWLDGRNTGGGGHEGHEGHDMGGAMTIRSAVLDMQGNLTNDAELDNRVCDCCQTAGVMTPSGPAVAFRDRSEEDVRDMSLVRFVNNEWSQSQGISQDNWNIRGCPVNGPRLASFGETLGMIWFTAANGEPKVKARFSKDSGASFGETFNISSETIGRVDMAMLDANTAIVSWLAANDTASFIMSAQLKIDGTLANPVQIAQTSSSRASGFPQLTQWKGKSYFAWTNLKEDNSTILVRSLSLD